MIFRFLSNLFSHSHSLQDHLKATKKIKVRGVPFIIKKIKVMDYLEGARVMQEAFSVYKTKEQQVLDEKMEVNMKKAQKFMTDLFMAAVVSPKLSRDPNPDDGVFVGDIFGDWLLAQELTQEILMFTYGKKK